MRADARVLMLVAACLALSGCGEVAFKRGGSSEGFAADRRACHAQTSDDTAYRACLNKEGWTMAELDSDSPTPGATPEAPSAPAAPPQTAAVVSSVDAPAVVTTAAAVPTADPLAPVSVGSWWKLGAGSGDLHAAIDQCVAQLGPENQPESAYRSVTRALYLCLGEHGWHGLGHAG